jgi:hypothetical protein
MMMPMTIYAIDELRAAARALSYCNESFLRRFTMEQLLAIRRAWVASEWDIHPDEWTERQVKDALKGRVPTWNAVDEPTYGSKP